MSTYLIIWDSPCFLFRQLSTITPVLFRAKRKIKTFFFTISRCSYWDQCGRVYSLYFCLTICRKHPRLVPWLAFDFPSSCTAFSHAFTVIWFWWRLREERPGPTWPENDWFRVTPRSMGRQLGTLGTSRCYSRLRSEQNLISLSRHGLGTRKRWLWLKVIWPAGFFETVFIVWVGLERSLQWKLLRENIITKR